MSRILFTVLVLVCCLSSLSFAGDPRERQPVAVATVPAHIQINAAQQVLMSTNQRMFIAATAFVTPGGVDVSDTLAKLRARHGNVYALAVNSGNVTRATTAVKVNGRVYLRASGDGNTHLASR